MAISKGLREKSYSPQRKKEMAPIIVGLSGYSLTFSLALALRANEAFFSIDQSVQEKVSKGFLEYLHDKLCTCQILRS